MQKVVSSILLTLVLCALVANPVTAEGERIGVLLKTLSNPFWVAAHEGVLDAAVEYGISVDIAAAPTEQDVDLQLNTLEVMLLKDYDAIIVAALTGSNLFPGLREATRAGIPIVDLDANLDLKAAEEAGITVTTTVASDNYEAGALAARYIIEQTGGQGKVFAMEGISGSPTGAARVAGFIDTIESEAPGMQVVGVFAGDWDRLKAADITADMLTAHRDLVGIYAANDTMALGAVETLYASGVGGQIVVVGTDGNADARDSIVEGRLNATVAQLPYVMGQMSVEAALTVLRGGSVESRESVPLLLLTKDVIEAGDNPMLQYVR